jgi:hypothetical protein
MKNENQPLLLDTLQEIDIRTVDPKDLVDIKDVTIREELPLPERVRDYIQQIKNPYCYLSHGTVVKIRFAGSRTLEECINSCISMEA